MFVGGTCLGIPSTILGPSNKSKFELVFPAPLTGESFSSSDTYIDTRQCLVSVINANS